MTKKMKIFVTGATGYIGSKLLLRLLASDFEVSIIKRECSDLTLLGPVVEDVSVYEYDGSTQSVIEALQSSTPDIVIHLASLFIAEHKSSDIEDLINSNLMFSTQISEAIKVTDCKYLLNAGTSWEHFESSIYNPTCLYAATKYAYQAILKYYIETGDLSVITLKLFDTYGPDDHRPKLIPFLKKISRDNTELEMSPGGQLIDIVHIDDVLGAFLCAVDRLLEGLVSGHEIYAVSSGSPITVKQLVSEYEKVLESKINIRWGKRPYRDREVMIPWNTGSVLPNWEPSITLSEGLKTI